jgi:hypothetical protein
MLSGHYTLACSQTAHSYSSPHIVYTYGRVCTPLSSASGMSVTLFASLPGSSFGLTSGEAPSTELLCSLARSNSRALVHLANACLLHAWNAVCTTEGPSTDLGLAFAFCAHTAKVCTTRMYSSV